MRSEASQTRPVERSLKWPWPGSPAGRGSYRPLIGARTMEQLEDNLGSVTGQLSEEDTARLDAASALEPGYPERYLARFTRS